MAERHRAALKELGELGMALAREVQAAAVAAPTEPELALAYHRVSRAVRQTFALEARLARDVARDEREAAVRAANEEVKRLTAKRSRIRRAVSGLIWTEHEGEEAEALLEALEDRLCDHALPEDFPQAPLDACIERIRRDLGLAPANGLEAAPPAGAAPFSPSPSPSPALGEAAGVTVWRSSG